MDGANEDNPWTPLNPTSSTTYSLLGKRRACSAITKYEWTFISLVSFTLLVVLGLTIYRIIELPVTSSDFTLAILLLINICFCYFYAYHGVLFEQPFELYFLVITSVVIFVYSTLSYHSKLVHDSLTMAKFGFIILVSPTIVILGFHIGCGYKKSGHLVFRTVGGDPFMQSVCFQAQLLCVLLLFDAQAIYCCIILIIHEVGINLLQELLVLILGSIFTVLWMVLGYLTVRLESLPSMALFLILCVVQPSYVVWRLISAELYQTDTLEKNLIFASGGIFLLVHIYLIVNTFLVYKNFGKGLKEKIYGYQEMPSQYGAVDAAANA